MRHQRLIAGAMSIIANTFTWWNGAGFGTWLSTRRFGKRVGHDAQGNVYYEHKADKTGRKRRSVIYKGSNDASRVPPEWHGWLHGTIDDLPENSLPPARRWEREPTPNLTGTRDAYLPAGALQAGGERARAKGDYEAWQPESDAA